eukprot:7068351-Alexandrium_andersonii.AAC.1
MALWPPRGDAQRGDGCSSARWIIFSHLQLGVSTRLFGFQIGRFTNGVRGPVNQALGFPGAPWRRSPLSRPFPGGNLQPSACKLPARL